MNKKTEKKFNPNDYIPKRFALNFTPPFIVLEYLVPSTGKLYHHKMRLHKFSIERTSQDMFNQIYTKHSIYLDKIQHSQMIGLIDKLKAKKLPIEKVYELPHEEPKVKIEKKENNIYKGSNYDELEYDTDEFEDDYDDDDNDNESNTKAVKMEVVYRKNNITDEDDEFEYNSKKDVKQDEYAAEWDESF